MKRSVIKRRKRIIVAQGSSDEEMEEDVTDKRPSKSPKHLKRENIEKSVPEIEDYASTSRNLSNNNGITNHTIPATSVPITTTTTTTTSVNTLNNNNNNNNNNNTASGKHHSNYISNINSGASVPLERTRFIPPVTPPAAHSPPMMYSPPATSISSLASTSPTIHHHHHHHHQQQQQQQPAMSHTSPYSSTEASSERLYTSPTPPFHLHNRFPEDGTNAKTSFLPPISSERQSFRLESLFNRKESPMSTTSSLASGSLPPLTLPPLMYQDNASSKQHHPSPPPLINQTSPVISNNSQQQPEQTYELADFDMALDRLEHLRRQVRPEQAHALSLLTQSITDLASKAEAILSLDSLACGRQ
jgi:hypothetical protein